VILGQVTAISCSTWGVEPVELSGQGASLRQVHIAAGHVAARHSHGHEQFLRVISGAGRLDCEAGAVALEPGVTLHLPAGAWHSASFTADTVLLEVNLAG
jgi:quercetin dioxygenase-like cupin family protein